MEYDFSSPALINAGGGLLFFLAGVMILLLGWRSLRGRLVGALATSFGIAYAVQNLIVFDGSVTGTAIITPPALVAAGFACVLVHHLAQDLTPPARRRVAMLAVALIVPIALILIGYGIRTADRGLSESRVFLDNVTYAGLLAP